MRSGLVPSNIAQDEALEVGTRSRRHSCVGIGPTVQNSRNGAPRTQKEGSV